jgi:streptogramin lyase
MYRVALFLFAGLLLTAIGARAATVSGTVRTTDGKHLPGIFVTARDESLGVAVGVTTDRDGKFRIPNLAAATYLFRIHQSGYEDVTMEQAVDSDVTSLVFVMQSAESTPDGLPASALLGLLPDGKEKRRFIIDCMGCHSLNRSIIFKGDGSLLDMPAWKASVEKMLSFSGYNTAFPIMAPDRLAGPTAEFMARYLTDASLAEAAARKSDIRAPAGGYTVTEYDLPEQRDFPHDLMLDGRGNVLVTGMFSGMIYMLNPSNGEFTTEAIPTDGANPRALDVDAEGNWWILCGMPRKIARYTVATGNWDFFDIGMYPHSIKVDDDKRVWFNGHFTNNPIKMGFVDGAGGRVETMEVSPVNMPSEEGGPIPYGLRVGPDGTVWSTELAGNRLIKYVPETKEMKAYEMPSPHSGPRRLDVAPDGVVWIPEFTTGKLARFNPDTESFTEYDFPTSNSLPYCARVNPSTGVVWISQCANDGIARFDPSTEAFVEFRLPTRVAFIRHLDIDPRTGDVWAAYSHSPGLHPRIVRLQVH